ncbi:hypothetical protein ACIP98_38550 [Streptomyces sp. NPDC088354]|uniref:hypothetical protein n=1 Tax=Streptomyces sp. NPDC088354 TaxID=3365856 RepID=UPI003830C80B
MSDGHNAHARREQHNHGPGTFVGRDVHGGIWNFFINHGTHRRNAQNTPGQGQRTHEDHEQADDDDDYEAVFSLIFMACWIAGSAALAVWFCLLGEPFSEGEPPPGVAARIGVGLLSTAVALACLASLLARVAQVFELWSERAAQTAIRDATRWRRIASVPAAISSGTARIATVAAVSAGVLAALYGWTTFGSTVSDRAHLARTRAQHHAATARAAVTAKR